MSVTAEQAFDLRDADEPVMISAYHTVKLIVNHGQNIDEFFAGRDNCKPVDLADVLEWLGY